MTVIDIGQSVFVAGLTPDERALLFEVTADRPDLERLVGDLDSGRHLSVTDANALRDAVGEAIEVDPETGEITERGIRFDDLIDRIAQLSGMWRAGPPN